MKKILFVIVRYSDHRQQIFEEKISPINRAYCEKHGFKYVEIKNDVNLQLFRSHPTWWKFTIVRDLIDSGKVNDGDVVAHLDADMVIVNDSQTIEPKKSFGYSICSGNTHCMGWYSLKINDWSKQLIKNILSEERYQKLNNKITIHDYFKTYSSFWHDFREQASWYSLAGIKRHSDKPFWEYPNNGFHSEKNEDTLYSINELEDHVDLFPTTWNVTELEGETACQFNINKVKREEVILRHFAGGQPWLVDQWKK